MNDTHDPGPSPTEDVDEALADLAEADPADAADIAESIAARLTEQLDGPGGNEGESPESGTAR